MFKRIVTEERYAPKATVGPRYNSPNRQLKTKQRRIAGTGTLRFGEIREK